jgi:hypothetical protein
MCENSSRIRLEPVKYVFNLITEILKSFEIGVDNELEENDSPFSRKALNELEIDWFGRAERGKEQYERNPSQLFQVEDVGVRM